MDFKFQVNRGDKTPDKWDQRKSNGSFQGHPDLAVRTAFEFRANEDVSDLLTNPDRLEEFIMPGDNALMVINRILGKAVESQPEIFGPAASLLGLEGTGKVDFDLFAYDND